MNGLMFFGHYIFRLSHLILLMVLKFRVLWYTGYVVWNGRMKLNLNIPVAITV